MMKKNIITVVLIFSAVLCFGDSNFYEGEQLLMQGKPAQALDPLARAMSENPSRVTTYIYIGIAYEQLGRVEEAIAVYRRALPIAGILTANVANNLANVYFLRGNSDMAEQYYTQAIGFNSIYSNAYLGRANTRIKTGNYKNAIADYEHYISLEPRSEQRGKIESLINLLHTEAAAEEMKKMLAEEEARRIAEERQKLLDAVSASLQSAADASKGLSFGAESVEGYVGEFELE